MGTKMNGSVDLLAKAMAQVISEATENAVEPINERLGSIEGRMGSIEGRMGSIEGQMATKEDLETTNKNVQAQLAQHRKSTVKDVQNIIGGNA